MCGEAEVGKTSGTVEFWHRIIRLYSKAFPTRAAEVFEKAEKHVEILRAEAALKEEEPSVSDVAEVYAEAVHSLPPLTLAEVGQLYDTHEQFPAALDHYARHARIFSIASANAQHVEEPHARYDESLFALRTSLHRMARYNVID